MQHKKGTFEGKIVVSDWAFQKSAKATQEHRIKISRISMASKKAVEDYPHLAQWFCLSVSPRAEFLVENDLQEAGVDALVPTRIGNKIMKRGRIIPAPRLPVMPGYLLVRCVPSVSAIIGLARFNRVRGIVGGMEKPYRIPLSFVEKFIEKAAQGGYDHRLVKLTFAEGEPVRVIDGPFASFVGPVIGQDIERCRVKVEVDIFGRPTPVELDVAQIEKV